jgi:hypothetical protein
MEVRGNGAEGKSHDRRVYGGLVEASGTGGRGDLRCSGPSVGLTCAGCWGWFLNC